jgi:hypothetical protein
VRIAFTVLVVAALVAAPAPSSATAQTQLPVGEADGVRIVRERGAIVVVFTSRAADLWRRVAGRRVSVMCVEWSGPDEQGFISVNSGGSVYRAPRRGRRIRTGDLTRGMDVCHVTLESRRVRRRGGVRVYGPRRIASIPMSRKGAVYLDEVNRVAVLQVVLLAATVEGRRRGLGRPLTAEELLERVKVVGRPVRLSLVALASPSDTPPTGSVGYYSDGAEHVAAVVVSATGRRLFIEWEPGGVLRTNVAGMMYGDRLDEVGLDD